MCMAEAEILADFFAGLSKLMRNRGIRRRKFQDSLSQWISARLSTLPFRLHFLGLKNLPLDFANLSVMSHSTCRAGLSLRCICRQRLQFRLLCLAAMALSHARHTNGTTPRLKCSNVMWPTIDEFRLDDAKWPSYGTSGLGQAASETPLA